MFESLPYRWYCERIDPGPDSAQGVRLQLLPEGARALADQIDKADDFADRDAFGETGDMGLGNNSQQPIQGDQRVPDHVIAMEGISGKGQRIHRA